VLLGSIAYPWAYNVRLEGLIPDLPADSPLALADEACGLAAASADPEIIDETQWCRLTTLAGHPEVDEYLREAERTIAAGYSFGAAGWTQLMIAHVRLGRLDELATLSAEMQEIGDRTGDRLVHGMAGAAATSEALLRGRIEDARIATDNVIASAPDVAILQLGWAQLTVARLLHAGRPDEARAIADRLAAAPAIDYAPFAAAVARAQGDLDPSREVLAAWHAGGHMLAQESELGARLWALAECAHALGDQDAAGRLYDQLLPYDGQLLNLAVGWVPASAAFTLGLLAETLGDRDRAPRHYTEAIAFEERIRAEVLAVRTRAALARISG
jgi:tetratricopeptide (TPR) repeat protein